jgi:hypothetical protein
VKPIILHNFSDINMDRALEEVDRLARDGALARYDNPFEQKSFLEDKNQIKPRSHLLYWILHDLATSDTCRWASSLLNLPVVQADIIHYGGLFVYNRGDYLAPHVDAGIHPLTHQRKVATALLYLTPAELSFWHGDSCLEDKPEVWLEERIHVAPNTCVLFANDDWAWHSVPRVKIGTSPRVVLTVSYMAESDWSNPRYRNQRTRAYFAKRYGVHDDLDGLRRQRASEEQHASVYRLESEGTL